MAREQGNWVGKNYVATVRKGVKWSDGAPLTAADVKFTFETPSTRPPSTGRCGRRAYSASTRRANGDFHFRGVPNYQEWDSYLYTVPIVPMHVWKGYSQKKIISGNTANVSKDRHRAVRLRRRHRRLADAAVEQA